MDMVFILVIKCVLFVVYGDNSGRCNTKIKLYVVVYRRS